MVRETGVQSQVESYQSLKKWFLIPPCLTLSIIRCVSRVKWSNPGNAVAPSPTSRCCSYWKGSFQVVLDYGHQLYFTLHVMELYSSARTGTAGKNSRFMWDWFFVCVNSTSDISCVCCNHFQYRLCWLPTFAKYLNTSPPIPPYIGPVRTDKLIRGLFLHLDQTVAQLLISILKKRQQ